MENNTAFYYISTKVLMQEDYGKKDDVIESVSDMQKNELESGLKAEKQEVNESKAKQMYQIWGDNFISDSLH